MLFNEIDLLNSQIYTLDFIIVETAKSLFSPC